MSEYDVVVIGGGAAGLAGAVALLRARRTVLVVDAGEPRNAPADGVHNFLTRENTPPAEIVAAGRAEVEGYGGTIVSRAATAVERRDGGFRVLLDDGAVVSGRRLLLATGLVDELPDLPGVAQRWGSDVLHCPYCHGWEVRDQPLGVLGDGPMAVHQALMWRQWSDDLVLFLHRAPEPTDDEREQLAARGVRVVEGEVAALELSDGRMSGVRLAVGRGGPADGARRRTTVHRPRRPARSARPGRGTHGGERARLRQPHPGRPDGRDRRARRLGGGQRRRPAREGHLGRRQRDGRRSRHQRRPDRRGHPPRRRGAAERGGMSQFEQPAWEDRYRAAPVWSGRANPQLVAEIAELGPGTALDVGCGEGGDALWLAELGWRVTAVDFSTVALARGAAHAQERGLADRIDWVHADLRTWTPPEAAFDLVTAQYMHLPVADRKPLFDRLAAAVAPGGTLLIVGHLVDAHDAAHHGHAPGMFFTAEEVAADLDRTSWEVLVTDTRKRPDDRVPGRPVEDAVLHARRRPGAERNRMRAIDRETYDEMYRSAPAVWSGRPNRQLVVEGSELPPGTALDAGCGEGADALWLAERGWRVTAVDFSTVALERGAAHARERGLDDLITWLHADLDEWTPGEERFDLVTAHYLHSRGADRVALFERLAAAVAPGGTLLVVGHLLGEGADDHDGDAHQRITTRTRRRTITRTTPT